MRLCSRNHCKSSPHPLFTFPALYPGIETNHHSFFRLHVLAIICRILGAEIPCSFARLVIVSPIKTRRVISLFLSVISTSKPNPALNPDAYRRRLALRYAPRHRPAFLQRSGASHSSRSFSHRGCLQLRRVYRLKFTKNTARQSVHRGTPLTCFTAALPQYGQ